MENVLHLEILDFEFPIADTFNNYYWITIIHSKMWMRHF